MEITCVQEPWQLIHQSWEKLFLRLTPVCQYWGFAMVFKFWPNQDYCPACLCETLDSNSFARTYSLRWKMQTPYLRQATPWDRWFACLSPITMEITRPIVILWKKIEGNGQVAFRYCDKTGALTNDANHNGSIANIAGITNQSHTVLGMMPHPERHIDPLQGGTDGKTMFECLLNSLKA